jgi:hypothetical protein
MVEINGHASAVGTEGADYEALVASVRRPDELASGLVTLASVSSELGARYAVPVVTPMTASCFWPCFRCGTAAAGLVIGGTAALVATCGAAVATAGVLTPACVAGGVAYFSGALAVADACLSCDACLNPKPPSSGGRDCPPGQHECCPNQCCSDADLPPPCE